MSILVVIAVYDLNHFIIPDALTIALTVVSVGWLGVRFVLGEAPFDLGFELLAAILGASFFFVLWAVSRGRWIGFGDVKLAMPLGLIVGSSMVFSLVVFSFWIGAIISVLLIGVANLQGGKLGLRFPHFNLTIKSVVPFAPFMIASCLLILFTNLNVLSLFSF
jgi:leader peptidase (prepilin peptidase)/N-methyltransferase